MNLKKTIKNKIILLSVLSLSTNMFACCGCAIVNASLESVNTSFETSMTSYDTVNSSNYEAKIIANMQETLGSIKDRLTNLNANIEISKLTATSEEDCKNEINRFNSLNSIKKTQKIIDNFEN
ncbi:hypothetical protein [Poseidonibacter ostreae]|uniref:Lipoprotein n=1 Tax=Poseidonibacter ostreae TaxID=2654171 RepID=A0A6L4WX20_9BACT|nr:hypothetical protein [Poseidonibacter ostreae]KAB7891293.1 hypothetical protein GBG19_00220 [Poseidonibacter ostreae]